jgi:formylglycine-generating enzyme required for sulfatase activity
METKENIIITILTIIKSYLPKVSKTTEWSIGDLGIIFNTIIYIVTIIISIISFCIFVFKKIFTSDNRLKILSKSTITQFYDKETIAFSTKYYIEPDCALVNAVQEEEQGKIFSVVDDYLSKDSRRYLIILADSGMGKTSFLLNYYARNLKRKKSKQRQIEIIPLCIKNSDDYIENIKNKHETVLFLDAFDEDILAIGNHRKRIHDLMNKCNDFKQVVITCRTQFFSKDEEIPKETGLLKVGPRKVGEGGYYEFSKVYLSPFTEQQVYQYLKLYYPWNKRKRQQAFDLVNKISSLKVLPMLLSYIPDLIESDANLMHTTQLYDIMINKWLERENRWVKKENLLRFSEMLAVDIINNKSKRGYERVSPQELADLASQWQIELKEWQISGRSLLNRGADGNYKFFHQSIMEYLFVRSFLKMPIDDRPMINWTNQMINFGMELYIIESCNLAKAQVINSIGMEFVFIPPGSFEMGTYKVETMDDEAMDDESGGYDDEILHIVTLSKGFFLTTTPVTQMQWKIVMENNPSQFKENGNNRPVENVSWDDAQAFIKKLNEMETNHTYCLPTEAEWEYACRAGTSSQYSFGNDGEKMDEYAWYKNNSDGMTHPVKQKKANAWGMFDMHGNVWGWCEDWYSEYTKDDVTDPMGPVSGTGRVIRGGGWSDSPENIRSGVRGRFMPGDRSVDIGFYILRKI